MPPRGTMTTLVRIMKTARKGEAAVTRSRNQLVLVMAACAAVVAQATPTAVCFACDHACCKATISGSEHQTTAANPESTSGCPLCAAYADLLPAETDGQPCTCQLDARQEQPLALSQNPLQQAADDTPASEPAAPWAFTPPALGLSRDYAALFLAMPIRPVRILFGVWRN